MRKRGTESVQALHQLERVLNDTGTHLRGNQQQSRQGPSESCFLNISNKDPEAPQLEISNRAFLRLPLPHAELTFVTNAVIAWSDPVCTAAALRLKS